MVEETEMQVTFAKGTWAVSSEARPPVFSLFFKPLYFTSSKAIMLFIPVLFIVTKLTKSNFLVIEDKVKRNWYNHVMEYDASTKSDIREEYLMNLKDVSNILIARSRLKMIGTMGSNFSNILE